MSKLISGVSYTLKEIFSGENDKIVIPDLQRDYCWGNPDVNLVGQFVHSLLEMDKVTPITMGLLYGYYNDLTPEHLQLCDGQQRLTTLFLILGMLNRQTDDNLLQNFLISDFELNNDDYEPYLQYAIRESSLYFLSDLTRFFFLQKDLKDSEDIKKQPWFLNSYRLDPTVCSILNAIDTIQSVFDNIDTEEMNQLSAFILNKLEFIFYDMEYRENGEETFVIINTTGEPLSATQNLKPLIIDKNIEDNPLVANQWEEMETWFWQNRRKDTEHPHTSDEGMDCFLNILRILHSASEAEAYRAIENETKFPYKEISFNEIHKAFDVYKRLYSLDFSERKDPPIRYPSKQKLYSQERLYAICPTICYCLKFEQASDEEIKRIYHLFTNMARYRDISRTKDNDGKFHSPLYIAISYVRDMDSSDTLSLREILNEEENSKLTMIYENEVAGSSLSRHELEILFADAESSEILNGRIMEFVKWSNNNPKVFEKYWLKFKSQWHSGGNLDVLRRALLTYEMSEYPIYRQGYGSLLNLCYNKKDWFNFIQKNSGTLKTFLDDDRTLEDMLEQYNNSCDKMFSIVKDGNLLGSSEYKNLYLYGDVVVLMKKERISSDYQIIYRGISYPKDMLSQYKYMWTGLWANEYCIYSDNFKYNLTLDLLVSKDGYRIVLWAGKHPEKDFYPYYDQIGEFGFFKNGNDCWEYPILVDGNEAKNKLKDIAKRIDDLNSFSINL